MFFLEDDDKMNKNTRNLACLSRALTPRNCSGSHVGVIISFVIFITFIVFLYVVISPAVKTGESKDTSADYIVNKITENVSANFTSAAIKIVSIRNPGTNCIQLKNFLAFLNIPPPYSLIVKNETGGIESAYYGSGTDFANLVINRKNKINLFFQIYVSPELHKSLAVNTISPCNSVTDYNISLVKTQMYAFENSTYDLINYYKTDYEKLKDEFNIAPGTEFGFGFIRSDGTRIEVGNVTVSVDIFAEEIPVQYIDDRANLLSGFINIKVW